MNSGETQNAHGKNHFCRVITFVKMHAPGEDRHRELLQSAEMQLARMAHHSWARKMRDAPVRNCYRISDSRGQGVDAGPQNNPDLRELRHVSFQVTCSLHGLPVSVLSMLRGHGEIQRMKSPTIAADR